MRPVVRARDKKDVILAYLNVLISQARISGCTKGRERPFGSSRGGGGGSHPARSMGEFSLWLRERAATMVIYLMRRLGRDNVAEGTEELRSEHALSSRGRGVRESVSKNNGPQHPVPPASS